VNSRVRLHIEDSPPEQLVRALEHRFGIARALPVGRAALGLAVVLECWRKQRQVCRVALPGAICHEVVVAVLAADCEPVFCDVDPTDGLVLESEWARARSLGADVAVMVHLYGNPAAVRPVRAQFPAPDCLVIDDAAQALGSSSEDGIAGTAGDVGILSFGATKQISTGNAALLFKDVAFAEAAGLRLGRVVTQPQAIRDAVVAAFRTRLEAARARLGRVGERAADDFSGLLEGMQPILRVPLSARCETATLRALEGYPQATEDRIAKKEQWSRGLEGTGLLPVGMGRGCVPWRYVCRLPGLTWSDQYRIAADLRAAGMHVSNWYLPAHWFVGLAPGALPGVEKLAREVFQFWLDEDATLEAIARQCVMVRQRMGGFGSCAIAGSDAIWR
jgi:DegT/DnrJ/EryC1/StrS aminotransferase family